MNIAEPFIRRPVATTLVMLGIVVFGGMSYFALPVSDLPNIDYPTIQVAAALPGASPETMAASVATPMEREFSTIAGLDSMTSSSFLGNTQITMQFNLSRDIDAAAQDVQAAIARAGARLPRDMPSPPSYKKVNPADQPILYLALTTSTLPLYTLNEYAETTMAQRISTISGVAQVQVFGAQKYAVRVQLDPEQLASMDVGIDEVATSIQTANSNLPTGSFTGAHQAFMIETNGDLETAADYRPVIVAYRNGRPVRLNELGRISDGVENDRTAAWFNDKRSISLAIQRQPGANTVAVVDAINRLLPTFKAQIPESITINTLYDRSKTIRESVHDVKFTLVLTLVLVVLVIFAFLRSISATVIPSLSIPVSIVGTFAVMKMLGFSLDNLSLMALTLSVGFIVDDAIVVLENIVRHIEKGATVMDAALLGAKEIGFTIVSMTLSLSAVFIPVLFMGGLLGRLLNEFAVTIAVAILISGFVSLTLTPMLCARFLRPHTEVRHGAMYRASERFFSWMLAVYEWGLRLSLRFRLTTMAISAVILAATVYLYLTIPKGFLPGEDTGNIIAQTEASEGISFEAMYERQQAAAAIIRADPAVANYSSSLGVRGGNASGTNTGTIFLRLKPRSERDVSLDQVIQRLRPKLSQIAGITVAMQNVPPIRIGGQVSKGQYQYTLQSPDTDELYQFVPVIEKEIRAIPGLTDVNTDLRLKNPQVNVVIDRDKASALGVTAEQVELALSSAYGSRQVSTIYAPTNQFEVILELEPEYRADPSLLSTLYVRASTGKLVPLGAVAEFRQGVGPLSVNHMGQLPGVTISFNLRPGFAVGDAVDAVNRIARNVLPATISAGFQGEAQAYEASLQGLGALLILAIMVTYIVLGILYESFIHPITILTALPFAGFGALATLLLFGIELNIYAFVGIIMLVGLVKKNGIMMVDVAIVNRREGKSAEEAIYDACVVRFRPIMMTTMAALLGTLPIAMGIGAGAESRQALGLAVVGGLLFSQTLTLFVTPVFYLYMERGREIVSGWRTGRKDVSPRRKRAVGHGELSRPLVDAEPVAR